MGPRSYLGRKIPLIHYLISGAPRGKDPSLYFCCAKYFQYNPGVRESGINPLAHFLLYGDREDLYKFSEFSSAPLKDMINFLNPVGQASTPSGTEHAPEEDSPAHRDAKFLTFCLSPQSRPMIIIDAELGGGSNLYSAGLAKEILEQSRSVITLSYDSTLRCIKASAEYGDFRISFVLTHEQEILSLVPLGKAETIFVNELVLWRSLESIFEILIALKDSWQAHLEFAAHDFFLLCPTVHLIDGQGNYCRLPSVDHCRKCLPGNRHSRDKWSDIDRWRDSWRSFIASIDKVLCFSNSTSEIIESIYPEVVGKVEIKPHHPLVTFPSGAYQVLRRQQLVIGIVGSILSYKGSPIVHDLAELLLKRNLEARIVVIGELRPACNIRNVSVTGRYRQEDLPGLLNRFGINVVLMPTVIPETFSFVTQEIIALGCPIVCFDLGAQAEQVRKYSLGRIASEISAQSALQAILELMSEINERQRGFS
ncbi:MAG: glycosyltransferase [Syntrophobacteraceae bacterium]